MLIACTFLCFGSQDLDPDLNLLLSPQRNRHLQRRNYSLRLRLRLSGLPNERTKCYARPPTPQFCGSQYSKRQERWPVAVGVAARGVVGMYCLSVWTATGTRSMNNWFTFRRVLVKNWGSTPACMLPGGWWGSKLIDKSRAGGQQQP